MPDTHDEESINALLRTAFAGRPEARSDVDFAARAMAAARAERPVPAATFAMTRPAGRASVWPLVLAAVGVGVMIVLAGWRLTEAWSWQTTEAALTQSASGNSVALLPVGGAVFLLAIVWVMMRSALSELDRADAPGMG